MSHQTYTYSSSTQPFPAHTSSPALTTSTHSHTTFPTYQVEHSTPYHTVTTVTSSTHDHNKPQTIVTGGSSTQTHLSGAPSTYHPVSYTVQSSHGEKPKSSGLGFSPSKPVDYSSSTLTNKSHTVSQPVLPTYNPHTDAHYHDLLTSVREPEVIARQERVPERSVETHYTVGTQPVTTSYEYSSQYSKPYTTQATSPAKDSFQIYSIKEKSPEAPKQSSLGHVERNREFAHQREQVQSEKVAMSPMRFIDDDNLLPDSKYQKPSVTKTKTTRSTYDNYSTQPVDLISSTTYTHQPHYEAAKKSAAPSHHTSTYHQAPLSTSHGVYTETQTRHVPHVERNREFAHHREQVQSEKVAMSPMRFIDDDNLLPDAKYQKPSVTKTKATRSTYDNYSTQPVDLISSTTYTHQPHYEHAKKSAAPSHHTSTYHQAPLSTSHGAYTETQTRHVPHVERNREFTHQREQVQSEKVAMSPMRFIDDDNLLPESKYQRPTVGVTKSKTSRSTYESQPQYETVKRSALPSNQTYHHQTPVVTSTVSHSHTSHGNGVYYAPTTGTSNTQSPTRKTSESIKPNNWCFF